MMKKYKGAIFDLDGILLDTEGFQWKGWNEVLKPYDISISEDEYLNYVGKTAKKVAQELVKKYSVDADVETLIENKRKIVIDIFKKNKMNFMPYAKEAVDFFLKNNFKIAVCSNSRSLELNTKIENSGIKDRFDTIVSSSYVDRGKPFPDIYQLAVNKLGLQADKCIAMEDTEHGVISAKEASLYTIAIPNKYTKWHNFSRADYITKDMKEVVELFGG